MSNNIWFDPTSDTWVLSDGKHFLEIPHWVREIIADEFERETKQLNAENAKLRELVTEMYQFMTIAEKLNAHIKLVPSEPCSFANRMRELGIEVE